MDKETLSNYGWIVICVLVIAVMVALATPFGSYIQIGIENTTQGFYQTETKSLNAVKVSLNNQSFLNPKMLNGDNQIINENGYSSFSFRSSAPIDTFKEVKVDGETVADTNYTVTEGSTIVTFTEQYARILSYGFHDVEIVSNDGYTEKSASATFSKINFSQTKINDIIKDKSVPSYFYYGDYKYTRNGSAGSYTWKVELNTSYTGTDETYTFGLDVTATDKNQTQYGEILESAFGYNVTNLSDLFYYCESLVYPPAIPENVINLNHCFAHCENLLVAPFIPNNVRNVRGLFFGCSKLKVAPVLPDGITDLQSTFDFCASLQKAPVIPDGVQNLSLTFRGCNSLTETPVFPESVTNMYYTFQGCHKISVSHPIPENVTEMQCAFQGCSSLSGSIEINANPSSYSHCLSGTHITEITGKTNLKNEILSS